MRALMECMSSTMEDMLPETADSVVTSDCVSGGGGFKEGSSVQ